jgi:hypothetical protein
VKALQRGLSSVVCAERRMLNKTSTSSGVDHEAHFLRPSNAGLKLEVRFPLSEH